MHSAKNIVSAISWNVTFALISVVVQVVVTMVLARLLTPHDYGVFAVANAVAVFGMHLSQRGLSTTIIRQKDLNNIDLSCSYIACAAISVVFVLVLLLTALMMQRFNGATLQVQSEILLFMALPLVLNIMTTPAAAMMQRRLATKEANLFLVMGIVVGNGGIAASLAALGYGAWSLAWGAAASAIINAMLTLWVERPPVPLVWDRGRFWALLREAITLNTIRAVGMAWVQIPLIVFGLKCPTNMVGIYQRTQFLADIIFQTTVCRVTGVFYVAFTHRQTGWRENYRALLLLSSTLSVPIAMFIWVAADPIISVLLGPSWRGGAWPLRVLSVAFGIYTINNQAAGITLELAGRFTERLIALGVAAIIVLALVFAVPPADLNLYALPALISIIASAVILHIFMGERVTATLELLRVLRSGSILGCATGLGGIIGRIFAMQFGVQSDLAMLIFQVTAALLLFVSSLPLIARTEEMKPFLRVIKQAMPILYVKLRPLHREP